MTQATTSEHTNMSRSNASADVDALKTDLEAVKSDLSKLMADLTQTGKATAREKKQQATDAIEEYTERSKLAAKRSHDELGDFVSERPITSLAIAAGAGAILARILSSR